MQRVWEYLWGTAAVVERRATAGEEDGAETKVKEEKEEVETAEASESVPAEDVPEGDEEWMLVGQDTSTRKVVLLVDSEEEDEEEKDEKRIKENAEKAKNNARTGAMRPVPEHENDLIAFPSMSVYKQHCAHPKHQHQHQQRASGKSSRRSLTEHGCDFGMEEALSISADLENMMMAADKIDAELAQLCSSSDNFIAHTFREVSASGPHRDLARAPTLLTSSFETLCGLGVSSIVQSIDAMLPALEWMYMRRPSVQPKLYKTVNRFGRPNVVRSNKMQMSLGRPKSKGHKKAFR